MAINRLVREMFEFLHLTRSFQSEFNSVIQICVRPTVVACYENFHIYHRILASVVYREDGHQVGHCHLPHILVVINYSDRGVSAGRIDTCTK